MKGRMLITIAALALAAACSSEGGGNPLFTSTTGAGGGTSTTAGGGGGVTTTAGGSDTTAPVTTTTISGQASNRPLPLREGLGTFDAYEWHMEVNTVGPTADETVSLVTDWSFDRDADATVDRTTTVQTGPDFDGPEESSMEVYAVDGETCQYDGDTWTYNSATDQQREVLDVAERLFDFTLVPESPVEIGQDTIAGIPATHYRFSVSGFGQDSGALVTENQMDYWVSNDTNVLVKFTTVVESRSGPSTDPEAEVYRVETFAELRSANVPLNITLPADCLAEADNA